MRADRPALTGPDTELFFVGDEFQSIYGFRHADVAGLPRAARGRPHAAAADAQLPLAARGARGRQPPLRRRVRRRVPAARGLRRVPRPGLRHAGRAARHRQGGVRRHAACTGAAPRRGTSRGACSELVDSGRRERGRDRPPLRRRHRRRVVRGGAARGGPADVPRDRPRLLRPAAGRRPARVPAPAAEPLRRRGARHACSPRRSSASRTTRSC